MHERALDPSGVRSFPGAEIDDVAGICNAGRNVFGMMPHPERAADKRLGNSDGLSIFNSLLKEVVVG